MSRPTGSVNLVRREFESDFWRYCDQNDFKPGFAAAKLMHLAAQDQDARTFVAVGVMADKLMPSADAGKDDAQGILFIVDRTQGGVPLAQREPIEHDAPDSSAA